MKENNQLKAIIAKNNKNFIGLNNKLPWKSKEDLEHFKKMTMGCKLLVGRTTYESMPKLPGRKMLVVGEGYYTLKEALELKPDWVIGGRKLYDSVLHLCSELHISTIDDNTFGDTLCPSLNNFKGKIFNYNFKKD